MKRVEGRKMNRGFALPTVIIASVVMMMVLLSGLTASSSINTAIRNQYDAKQLRLAAQSGVAMMNTCLAASYNQATWTASKPLRPNTDCNGDPISGASAYVLDTPTMKTSFEVTAVAFEYGAQRTSVTATSNKYRSSSPTLVATSDSVTNNIIVGSQTSFNNVLLGYCAANPACDGSHLAIVLATGEVKTIGMNGDGRLGAGFIGNRTTPQTFILPGSERGVAAFSNFLSAGRQISVLTSNGKVYSAGNNEYGQLGSSAPNPSPTPVQFGTVGNGTEKAKYVSQGLYTTYVVTDQNVYSAGSCTWAMLGWGCTSGTSSTVARVALPAYSSSNPNTQPATSSEWAQSDNLTTDSVSAFVRMKGGAVYGWGYGGDGQLGTGTNSSPSTPVKVGTFGDAGQPFASKIAFDGVTLYVLDSTGGVWATGAGEYGALAGAGGTMRVGSGLCLDNPGGATVGLRQTVYTCHYGDNQSYEWHPDGTIRIFGLCVENQNGVNADSNPVIINTCTGASNQQWVMNDDMSVRNPATGKCLDNQGGTATPGSLVALHTCNTNPNSQYWTLAGTWRPRKVPFPAGVTRFTKITTDQRSVVLLDSNGDAWGAGANNVGELGNGTFRTHTAALKKVTGVPASRNIVDVYTVRSAVTNTYFVLDDGSVYGSGQNQYGQLGTGGTSGNVATPVPMRVFGAGVAARSVRSGFGTTVIITTAGKVYTVGNNANGQLGDGTTNNSYEPKANQYTNLRPTIQF